MSLCAVHLCHIYLKGTPLQRVALEDVSFELEPGECVAVVGVSGSGKSTLATILAGLNAPTSGRVLLNGENVTAMRLTGGWGRRFGALGRLLGRSLSAVLHALAQRVTRTLGRRATLRQHTLPPPTRKIMLAFQNPEDQFFMTTVIEEVGVGLMPIALPERSGARSRRGNLSVAGPASRGIVPPEVLDALRLVDLDPSVYGNRNPFTLSGGEQRRLALAVLLARKPRVLILDEPSAGLDDPGRERLYTCINRIRREQNTAVLIVSHDLEEVVTIAARVIVLSAGRVVADGPVAAVLQDAELLRSAGLAPPPLVGLREALASRGYDLPGNWTGVDGAAAALLPSLKDAARGSDAHA